MAERLPVLLIVDDEVRSLESLARILQDDFDVKTAANVTRAREILQSEWVQIVLCDQRMPDMTGVEFLAQLREQYPDVVRIIISGYTDTEDVIRGINQAGIFQYITKPWQPDSLLLTLKNAAHLFDLSRQNELLATELKLSTSHVEATLAQRRQKLKERYQFEDGIIRGEASPMNLVCDRLRQVAPFDISVLLEGESGTGKELAARALHYNSLRWNKPFVAENCGAVPDELLESELFGHRRGAFTGAVADHVGLFERADGGTVFLDEIGEVSAAFQVKLLRVLQNGEIRALGSSKPQKVDVRIIAATNKTLEEEVRAGRFREDLYYRIAAMTIHLPPLRERKDDVTVIARAYLAGAAQGFGRASAVLTPEAEACLARYSWPGNIRELQNELQKLLILSGESGRIGAELLSPRILRAAPAHEPAGESIDVMDLEGSLRDRVDALEERILREALIRNRWNKSKAAKELGLSRVGLRLKLQRHNLENVHELPVKRRSAAAKD
ncbi:sigma-54-dependent Fis family transcriptional regulator [Aestuariivirga litoralis]|uniref:Sigma-54-dependent Fis family transcriptional regulator n=1 Tax=Aestuariivirga litoralis TaxID=2650924 RepID=A0A2W2BSP2_9HYPH|nr:sigma-54 dependent transcriptional regulator [Aestuariivirga litoralis]PZF76466.1 sigma-54-dependent Fis family transcriptional regulator [Aestuariivirga litoralis]